MVDLIFWALTFGVPVLFGVPPAAAYAVAVVTTGLRIWSQKPEALARTGSRLERDLKHDNFVLLILAGSLLWPVGALYALRGVYAHMRVRWLTCALRRNLRREVFMARFWTVLFLRNIYFRALLLALRVLRKDRPRG